jgi:threonine synthase
VRLHRQRRTASRTRRGSASRLRLHPRQPRSGKLLGSAIFNPTILAIAGNYDDVNRLYAGRRSLRRGFVNINLRSIAEGADDGLRDRRAARLALPETHRVTGRRRHPAAAHRARLARLREVGLVDGDCRASMRPGAGCARSCAIHAGLEHPAVRPDTIAKSIAIGSPADGYR